MSVKEWTGLSLVLGYSMFKSKLCIPFLVDGEYTTCLAIRCRWNNNPARWSIHSYEKWWICQNLNNLRTTLSWSSLPNLIITCAQSYFLTDNDQTTPRPALNNLQWDYITVVWIIICRKGSWKGWAMLIKWWSNHRRLLNQLLLISCKFADWKVENKTFMINCNCWLNAGMHP